MTHEIHGNILTDSIIHSDLFCEVPEPIQRCIKLYAESIDLQSHSRHEESRLKMDEAFESLRESVEERSSKDRIPTSNGNVGFDSYPTQQIKIMEDEDNGK